MTYGYYNDVLIHCDSGNIIDRGWRHNRIVHSSDILIASMMKGMDDIQGILYIALGTGLEEWDDINPFATPETSQLSNEFLRIRVEAEQIGFIDALNQPSLTPTNRLEVSAEFIGAEIVEGEYLSLREFGLFGGNATDDANSGHLINYVIHPRIDLTPNATLRRRLHLTFNSALHIAGGGTALPYSISSNWIQDAPLGIIDGAGKTFIARLADVDIHTIGDLAKLEPAALNTDIPMKKLIELNAKARFAISTISELGMIAGLHNRKLDELMKTPTSLLASESGSPLPSVSRLYAQLGNLQMTLDDRFLKNKTVLQLISGQNIEL